MVTFDPLYIAALHVAAIGNHTRAQAFIGNPGIGFLGPLNEAARLALKHDAQLLIPGHHNPHLAAKYLPEDRFEASFGIRPTHSQVNARHTGEQAAWLADRIAEMSLRSVAICVHMSHRARFFSTLAEGLRRRLNPEGDFAEVEIYIVPYWDEERLLDVAAEVAAGMDDNVGAHRTLTNADTLQGEFDRYQRVGYQTPREDGSHDMLSPKQLEKYLEWWHENAALI